MKVSFRHPRRGTHEGLARKRTLRCVGLAVGAVLRRRDPVAIRCSLLGTPTPAARGAAVTPVSFAAPASAQATPGVGLGRPLGVGEPVQENRESSPPDFRPVLDRPLSVVRGQAPDAPVQPLPVGFPLTQESGKDPERSRQKSAAIDEPDADAARTRLCQPHAQGGSARHGRRSLWIFHILEPGRPGLLRNRVDGRLRQRLLPGPVCL